MCVERVGGQERGDGKKRGVGETGRRGSGRSKETDLETDQSVEVDGVTCQSLWKMQQ